jgi:hypothetical protein
MRFVVGVLLGTALGAAAVRFLRPQTTPPAALKAPSGASASGAGGAVAIDVSGAPPEQT